MHFKRYKTNKICLTSELINVLYTTNLPKYYPKAQLISMHVSLFYKLCHPLLHGPTSMVCINGALLTMSCMAKRVKVVCLANKSKSAH